MNPILVKAQQILTEKDIPHRSNDNISAIMRPELRTAMVTELEKLMKKAHAVLLIDPNDPNSKDTPLRVARSWVNELFGGRYDQPPAITSFPNEIDTDQMIVMKGIHLYSQCSHHLMPFMGTVYIGVLPGKEGKLLGFSKYARLVHYYASRGQMQEGLTHQLASHLKNLIQPMGLGIVIESQHTCMSCRGVNETNSIGETNLLWGAFRESSIKAEFLASIARQQAMERASNSVPKVDEGLLQDLLRTASLIEEGPALAIIDGIIERIYKNASEVPVKVRISV